MPRPGRGRSRLPEFALTALHLLLKLFSWYLLVAACWSMIWCLCIAPTWRTDANVESWRSTIKPATGVLEKIYNIKDNETPFIIDSLVDLEAYSTAIRIAVKLQHDFMTDPHMTSVDLEPGGSLKKVWNKVTFGAFRTMSEVQTVKDLQLMLEFQLQMLAINERAFMRLKYTWRQSIRSLRSILVHHRSVIDELSYPDPINWLWSMHVQNNSIIPPVEFRSRAYSRYSVPELSPWRINTLQSTVNRNVCRMLNSSWSEMYSMHSLISAHWDAIQRQRDQHIKITHIAQDILETPHYILRASSNSQTETAVPLKSVVERAGENRIKAFGGKSKSIYDGYIAWILGIGKPFEFLNTTLAYVAEEYQLWNCKDGNVSKQGGSDALHPDAHTVTARELVQTLDQMRALFFRLASDDE